jgi:hypothetical protein
VTGLLFIAFGVAISARTFLAIGLTAAAVVPLVMGGALVGLGLLRVRDYLRLRRGGA